MLYYNRIWVHQRFSSITAFWDFIYPYQMISWYCIYPSFYFYSFQHMFHLIFTFITFAFHLFFVYTHGLNRIAHSIKPLYITNLKQEEEPYFSAPLYHPYHPCQILVFPCWFLCPIHIPFSIQWPSNESGPFIYFGISQIHSIIVWITVRAMHQGISGVAIRGRAEGRSW